MFSIKLFSVLLVLAPFSVYSDPEKDFKKNEPQEQSKFSLFNCWKFDSCKHEVENVCGYDEFTGELVVFEDRCTLYKANCKGVGNYIGIGMQVCQMKIDFQEHYGDTFDWQHITQVPFIGKDADKGASSTEGPKIIGTKKSVH